MWRLFKAAIVSISYSLRFKIKRTSKYINKIIRYVFGQFYWHQQSDLLTYKGSWKKDCFHGKGQLKYSNGTLFKGHFKNGSKTGFGKLVSPNGYHYEGEWISGKKTGYAKII
ncbi:hypothetical protein N9D70_01790 [bacterium]|nr:hypothetical protein [bacterium]